MSAELSVSHIMLIYKWLAAKTKLEHLGPLAATEQDVKLAARDIIEAYDILRANLNEHINYLTRTLKEQPSAKPSLHWYNRLRSDIEDVHQHIERLKFLSAELDSLGFEQHDSLFHQGEGGEAK